MIFVYCESIIEQKFEPMSNIQSTIQEMQNPSLKGGVVQTSHYVCKPSRIILFCHQCIKFHSISICCRAYQSGPKVSMPPTVHALVSSLHLTALSKDAIETEML